MYLSLNWLKEYIDIDLKFSELDNTLTMLGIEVEKAEFTGEKFNNFIVAEVLEKEKHPDADKLSVCVVNTGNSNLQVICGAPNVAKGQKVILGLSGAVVPNGGFKLEKRKIRGVESNGMICSLVELNLGEDGSGIHVLPDDAVVGTPIADYFNLNDVILELGLTPNKSDCLSHLGIARELAAALKKEVKTSELTLNETEEDINNAAKVIIEDFEKCPRYTARVVKNCKIAESPDWLKKRLQSVGLRPINCAVDVTNYVLMESGQPLHAFDLDKIAGGTIIVQTMENGTKFTTLDGKERELDSDMLMICDAEKPIAIGGVMGGQNSEISDSTTNILIESAFFNPASVRKTSKKLALQSDSSYRFERGVDISNVPKALDKAAKMIAELCGGEILKNKIDIYPNPLDKKVIKLRHLRVNKIIGVDLDFDYILNILKSLQFEIENITPNDADIIVPYHRVDIEQEIDLIEEVARLHNYDNIENDFISEINFSINDVSEHLQVPKLRAKLRNWFVNNGFNEILTQNQLDPKSSALFTDNPVLISNPLGEELSIMRPSMLPSFLKVISRNVRNGNHNLRLFESGKIFIHESAQNQFIEGISEKEYLTFALTGSANIKQWHQTSRTVDFYDIKGITESLFRFIKLNGIKLLPNQDENQIFTKESNSIYLNNELIGYLGAVNKNILKMYDIETDVYIASFSMQKIYKMPSVKVQYQPFSQFPRVQRDLAFTFEKSVEASSIIEITFS